MIFMVMVAVTVGIIIWASQGSGMFDLRSRASGFAPTPLLLRTPTPTDTAAAASPTPTVTPTPDPQVTSCLDNCLKNPGGGFQQCYSECYAGLTPTPTP